MTDRIGRIALASPEAQAAISPRPSKDLITVDDCPAISDSVREIAEGILPIGLQVSAQQIEGDLGYFALRLGLIRNIHSRWTRWCTEVLPLLFRITSRPTIPALARRQAHIFDRGGPAGRLITLVTRAARNSATSSRPWPLRPMDLALANAAIERLLRWAGSPYENCPAGIGTRTRSAPQAEH